MKKTLKLKSSDADKAFAVADSEGKKLLISLYPDHQFLKNVEDRVLTLDDVFKETGANPEDYNFPATNNRDVIAGNNMVLWLLIVYCFNGCKDADWSTGNYFYFPYAKYSSGSGWAFDVSVYWVTSTDAGARLGFINPDHVKICVERFPEIYKKAYQLI
ncbi:hypothetical protein [Flavobacterium sp.]|uniref:hypothetical protein n=1 Tax=Flavobacterium sp. TaxID=239 RepID=UPI0026123D43|nr:hypothetical protein [Flavobacterium sp.]